MGVGTLVSSQETKSGCRPADKLLINRLLCSPISLHGISLFRASGQSSRTVVFDALGGTRAGCFLGGPTRRRPVLLRPAPPRPTAPPPRCARPAPTRTWYTRVLDLSNPKPGHTTGGSGWSARRSGRAGSGKIRCQHNYSPRKQKSTVPS